MKETHETIHWKPFDTLSEPTVTCRCGAVFRSHAKFVLASMGPGNGPGLYTRKPCPACGSYIARRASSDAESMTIGAAEVRAAEADDAEVGPLRPAVLRSLQDPAEESDVLRALREEVDGLQRSLDRTSAMLEHERYIHQQDLDRLEGEAHLLRAGLRKVRLDAVRIRDEYANGERMMQLHGSGDPVHASRVFQGPISALLLIIGSCNSVESVTGAASSREESEETS